MAGLKLFICLRPVDITGIFSDDTHPSPNFFEGRCICFIRMEPKYDIYIYVCFFQNGKNGRSFLSQKNGKSPHLKPGDPPGRYFQSSSHLWGL